jgi:hypothetical protein
LTAYGRPKTAAVEFSSNFIPRKQARMMRPLASRQVLAAIADLLDNCAQVKKGQRVIILGAVDGLYGGVNLVEEEVLMWLHAGVLARGGHPSVIWTEISEEPGSIRVPPIVKAALKEADLLINHVFDLPVEELLELRSILSETGVTMVRNMATTTALLASQWAQTSYELVSKIRSQATSTLKIGAQWTVEHANGSRLEGKIGPPKAPSISYDRSRFEGYYRPFPEGVFSPIQITETSGRLVFDRTLPWWSRFIGLPTRFQEPVELEIKNSHIESFRGGGEARILERFLRGLAKRVGEDAFRLAAFHGGVHPYARVSPHQCPDANYREFIEHHHSESSHFHLGSASRDPTYPYFLHITAELRGATFRVGEADVYKEGRLTALDDAGIEELREKIEPRSPSGAEAWVWAK